MSRSTFLSENIMSLSPISLRQAQGKFTIHLIVTFIRHITQGDSQASLIGDGSKCFWFIEFIEFIGSLCSLCLLCLLSLLGLLGSLLTPVKYAGYLIKD